MRTVFFDFDGTLQDLDTAFHAAVSEVLGPAARTAGLDREEVSAELNRHWPPLWAAFTAGAIAPDDLYPRWMAQACRSLGLDLGPGGARALAGRYEAVFEKRLALYPDVCPALATLRTRRRDIILGVVTNGPVDRQERRMKALGLESIFAVRVISEAVGFWKPDPRLFRHALQKAGTSAAEAAMIGDDPLSDVEGARAVGMRAIWLDRGGRAWPEGLRDPEEKVRTLGEAVDRLLALENAI